jgi:hypothetical protein
MQQDYPGPRLRAVIGLCSADGEIREATLKRRMEGQDDILPGNPGRDEPIGDPLLRPIVLDPDFPPLDIHVDGATVNPMLPIPTHGHQLVMPGVREEDLLDLDVAVRRLEGAVFPEDLLD